MLLLVLTTPTDKENQKEININIKVIKAKAKLNSDLPLPLVVHYHHFPARLLHRFDGAVVLVRHVDLHLVRKREAGRAEELDAPVPALDTNLTTSASV